jgi:hypothetical protein
VTPTVADPGAVVAGCDPIGACALGLDGVYVTQTGGAMGPWRSRDPRPASVQRVAHDGRVELVVTEVDGGPLSAPNDLAVTSGGVDILSSTGATIDFLATGGEPQNCLFVGDHLYITDFGPIIRLLRVHVGQGGRLLYRGAIERVGS